MDTHVRIQGWGNNLFKIQASSFISIYKRFSNSRDSFTNNLVLQNGLLWKKNLVLAVNPVAHEYVALNY